MATGLTVIINDTILYHNYLVKTCIHLNSTDIVPRDCLYGNIANNIKIEAKTVPELLCRVDWLYLDTCLSSRKVEV